MSLPGADELFRTTGGTALQSSTPQSDRQRANGEAPGGGPRVPAPSREGDAEAATAEQEAEPGADAEEAGAADAGGSGGTGEDARARTGTGGQAGPAAPGGPRTPAAPTARRDPEATEHGGREAGAEATPGGRARQGEREPAAPARKSARQSGGSAAAAQPRRGRGRGAARRPSGRERHDEKITVYVSAEELMDLEHARLVLRGDHGLAVDRGRIVREAVAVVLADLESRGDASILVRRLRGR
ncbi:hypothetical protein ABGB09_20795 [Streptomyces sp. B8F3]|uniref:hypothetical protein n=1 Tax=Streptomyces sp. B8F3 TaxID=3153573 RepID=UPI00325D0969